ncbi:protein YIP4 [Echria macrotheca]|uniref:Protein YIP4 n=1 Tax=Echria macrotheca TaxID=438768 RepID=A0AAJ0BD19_9PEZI|nr:protein YIP4 [Echria macrotheca]
MDPHDQTFMTIHNLTEDANILFASDSILDILGYQPYEVVNKSCFDYFHPDEVPLARSVHSRGVRLDKAAVLHYCRIRAKDGRWVSCECCFTIVHDVLVASTSIYSRGAKSEGRAMIAPRVRRLFSSSPRDPRYHMLEHLSPKFKMAPTEREPRAALVLNRFTRNLTVMFATNAVSTILGLRPDELQDRPFYHCIQENCLADAIACLESAKKNESIAYLRFFFRDPRQDDVGQRMDEVYEEDEADCTDNSSDSEDDDEMDRDDEGMDIDVEPMMDVKYRMVTPRNPQPAAVQALPTPPTSIGTSSPAVPRAEAAASLELEAVVSCTSDGLVVVLRRARPPIPDPQLPLVPAFNYTNGLFAAPWGQQPIEPFYPPELLYTFRAPFRPECMPLQDHVKAAGGPPRDHLLRSIRDVAVFAWAVVGINGNLANFGHGFPGNGAQPHEGLPIWEPGAPHTDYQGPENRALGNARLSPPLAPARSGSLYPDQHTRTSMYPSRNPAVGVYPQSFGDSVPPPGHGRAGRSIGVMLNGQVGDESDCEAMAGGKDYTNPSLEDDELIDPDDADLNDFDDPLAAPSHHGAAASSSSRAPLVSGTIGSQQQQQSAWTSRIPGEDRRAPNNTIDETVWETLRRDLVAVWSKMREVLYPRYLLGGTMFESEEGLRGAYANLRGAGLAGAREELGGLVGRVMDPEALLGQSHMTPGLRDWDLWGPLLFCLALSALLSLRSREEQRGVVFSGVFAMVWIGEAVVTMQIKLLGGNISFAQSVCIIGYTLFPLVLAALLSALSLYWVARIPIYLLLVCWSLAAGVSILGGSGVVKNRVGLAVYPLLLLLQ